MNTLDWEKEEITIENENKTEKRTVYYYIVDGKKLKYEELRPITCEEILERIANIFNSESYSIIINRCSCGYWMCDSVLAAVEENEMVTTWKLYNIHDEEIFAEYEFDAYQYYEIMKSIFDDAKEQFWNETYPQKQVAYLFYWKNGETNPERFDEKSYQEELLKYWKYQAETNNNEPEYFEDVRNNDFYRIKNDKWEEVAELNWPPRADM